MRRTQILLVLVATLCTGFANSAADSVQAADAWTASAFNAKPGDWPHWRGPEMNGISREKGLPESWDPDTGENLLWENKELASRSTPIVMNGKLYLLASSNPGTEQEGEKVICADAATGKILWENSFGVFLSDVPDTRVAWSCVTGDTETGDVFAQGVCGLFQCIDGETGKTKWSHSMSEEYGLLSTYGGRTNVPVVFDDVVVISAIIIGWGEFAKPQHRFLAFDKRNGQPVWFNGTRMLPDDTTYSTPVLSAVNGMPLMVFGSGDGGIHAFQPSTGNPVWKYEISDRGINTTAVIAGNVVISGHSEENVDSTEMGALFALKLDGKGDLRTTGGELWRNREQFVGKSSPLVIGDRIYAIEDKGTLLVVDLKTGKTIDQQKIGTQGRASAVYADGKLYCCEANGRWFIFKLTDDGLEQIHRLRLKGEVSASPIISNGRLYLTTGETMYCIGLKDAKPQFDPRPDPPAITSADDDTTSAQVQIVPCESLLRGGVQGHSQRHIVRLYNANGRFLRSCKPEEVKFSITGPGSIDDTGKYTSPNENEHGAVVVTAKFGELTGTARIRVIPDFPWTFDFNDGEIPVTWVGARYRHIAIDFDLYKKLEEKSEVLSRLYVYLRSEFVNFAPKRVFDNTTPAQRWSDFLLFTNLLQSVKTLDDAKATVDPMLTALKVEGVLSEWSWESLEGGQVRLTVQRGEDKVKGNGVMTKITTIPKGARSQGWMGRTDFSNYTIQADVYSALRDGKMGDAGVIGQRYRLDLMGASQELKIISWISHESKFKTVPFAWKANTWYTTKLHSSIKEADGKKIAVLQGKVWERGTDEPKEWTITWEDEPGNDIGSPGLFGNAKDAEVFFDNVKVTQN